MFEPSKWPIRPRYLVHALLGCLGLLRLTSYAQGTAYPATLPLLQDPGTAFVDVAVVPMDTERVLPHQTVLVQGGRIIALGPARQVRVPVGAVRIDGRGKYLIPGLTDMHTHLAMEDSAAAERALSLFLANGITTIRNVDYGQRNSRALAGFLLRLRARAAAGALVSPRIYTSGPWGPEQYIRTRSDNGDPPPVLDSVTAYIAAYKAAGYDFIKLHDESAVIAESVAVAAHRVGIPVMGHTDPTGLREALRMGYASIEHVDEWVGRRSLGDPPDTTLIPSFAAALRRSGTWFCPTLEFFELGGPDIRADTLGRWPELRYASADLLTNWNDERSFGRGDPTRGTLEMYRQIVRRLQEAQVGLLSGTDTDVGLSIVSYMVPGFSLHRELAALVGAGLTPYQALATSTRNVAAYFGTLSESGTVAVGKRADLVLLAGNPLVDIQQTSRIAGVMHGGRWFPPAVLAPRLADDLKALFTTS